MPQEKDTQKNNNLTLILAVIADGPRHGYGIAREIEQRSADALSLGEGALYPALRALENDGYVTASWEVQPSGPARKVYTLTETGRHELDRRVAAWQEYCRSMGRVIGGRLHGQPA